jgi:hypothetical protein
MRCANTLNPVMRWQSGSEDTDQWGVREDGRIIPAGPDCRVAPDVPIGELFESALRATGYDAAISRNEKSDDN